MRPRMSQSELARRAGVTAHAVYMWESGRRYPTRGNLQAVATALGVSIAELYGGELTRKRRLPKGLQDMIDQGLAEVPPTEEDVQQLLDIPWKGEPDAICFYWALQAIRRARTRLA